MPTFKGTRRVFSEVQQLDGTKEKIIPLLCPVREYDWIEDWACDVIYSESGIAEPNCVFRTGTGSTTRLEESDEEVWIVTRYEPPDRIDFAKFAAGLYVIKYEIILEDAGEGTVNATWSQHFTGLSEEGNNAIISPAQKDYAATIKILEGKLNTYLATGQSARGG
jgi:hypothetical protein